MFSLGTPLELVLNIALLATVRQEGSFPMDV